MAIPNNHQIHLATFLDVDIVVDTERVAAARLEDKVAPAIYPGQELRLATDRQVAFGRSLSLDLTNDSFRVASAKIADELRVRNRTAANDLGLKPGDRVVKRQRVEINGTYHDLDQEYIVSSVMRTSMFGSRAATVNVRGQHSWRKSRRKLANHP